VRIYLTGFMGSGKTTVGRLLAAQLGVPFVDLDYEVETRAGKTVRELFETDGEPVFREHEHEALRSTLALPDAVVATGGGTIAFERNAELMQRAGITVWLHPTFAVIGSRIGGIGKQDRPLFRDETQAFSLYRQRLPVYGRADWKIDINATETPEEIAARILLQVKSCGT
jgi:shikimate kinase